MHRFTTILLAVISIVQLAAPFRIKFGHMVGGAVPDAESVNKTDETASVPRLPSAAKSVEEKHAAGLSVAAEETASEAVAEEEAADESAAAEKAAAEKTQHQDFKERTSQNSVVSLNVGEALQDAALPPLPSSEKSDEEKNAVDQRSATERAAEEVAEENVEKTQHEEFLSNSQRFKIMKELKQQQNDPELEGKISWGPKGYGLTTEMMGIIMGPPGSPYEDGIFSVKIRIPSGYPFKPPLCQFTTKIYHPNVNSNGSISLDVTEHKWFPSVGISGLLKVIWSLVADPNPYDPLEPEIAQQYLNERDQFNQIANEWKIRYATRVVG